MNVTLTDINYPLNDHDGFVIFRRPSFVPDFREIARIPKMQTSYTDVDLEDYVEFLYRICAFNTYGNGPTSLPQSTINTGNPPAGTPTFTLTVS